MRIGCYIPYHPKLTKFLPYVIEQMSFVDELFLRKSDFKKEGQVNCRNAGLHKLTNCDWVFTLDSDEVLLRQDAQTILDKVKDTDYDCVMCPVINYTPDLKHCYNTLRYKVGDHAPIILVRPKKVEFYETRCARYDKPLYLKETLVHHFGFAYDPSIMDWKKQDYWNTGNPQEVSEIQSLAIAECQLPKELQCLTK